MTDNRNKKEILEAISSLLDRNDEAIFIERMDNLERKIEAGFQEIKNLISLKTNGQVQDAKPIEEIKKEAYNEAYIAIKNESADKTQEAFNKGVEYGKTLMKNKLDDIEKRILKEYAEQDDDYNNGISSIFRTLL